MNDWSNYSLQYAAPADDLKELVSSYYLFRAELSESRETERADRAQLRFLLEGSGGYEFHDGSYYDSAAVSIIGPTTGPTTGVINGPVEIFGIGLQPAGWGTLMGADAENHSNKLIDAAEIFGQTVLDMRAAIRDADSFDRRVDLANHFVRGALQTDDPAPFWFTRIVDQWLTGSASPEIRDLIEATGLSRRQVERMTKRFYGAPPKLLARKYRALRASSLLIRNGADGADGEGDGVDDVFYDQSHLIRELKEFTGLTPGRMRDAPPELVRAVAVQRNKLAGKVDKLISDT